MRSVVLVLLCLAATAWCQTMPGSRIRPGELQEVGAPIVIGPVAAAPSMLLEVATLTPDIFAVREGGTKFVEVVRNYNAAPLFVFEAAGGTMLNPTATSSGSFLGTYAGCGFDGSLFCGLVGLVDAQVALVADGTFTTSSHPTRIEEYTTPSGSTSRTLVRTTGSDGSQKFVGKVAQYNNINTVSNGVPSELGQINTTGLTANVASATLYAVPAAAGGLYRISALVVETTAASVSSTLPNVQIIYTDVDTNGSVTIDATPVLGVAGVGQTGALTANTVGTTATGVIVVDAKASTNINYQTVNYASSTAGMAYAIHLRAEAL